jgi:hypothetical protein
LTVREGDCRSSIIAETNAGIGGATPGRASGWRSSGRLFEAERRTGDDFDEEMVGRAF